MNKTLKYLRLSASLVILFAVTLLFATTEAAVALKLQWAARIQIVPLILSVSMSLIGLWVAVTLTFGRIYCSTVCPLGAFQDIVARARRSGRKNRQRHAYRYTRPRTKTRIAMLAVTVIAAVAGIPAVLTVMDPYSAYGRICADIIRPFTTLITSGEVVIASVAALILALLTIAVTGLMAYRSGRSFCNTLCPVGTGLGLLSRFSIFHFDIDTDLCIHCRRCEHVCKGSCINLNDFTVDGSRCVTCFNCVAECPVNAIRYTTNRKRLSIPMMQRVSSPAPAAPTGSPDCNTAASPDTARRRFMAIGLLAASAPAIDAADRSINRIRALENGSVPLPGLRSVTPPGVQSRKQFMQRCTGCGLCVSHCTGRVLVPSTSQFGVKSYLHPVMDFDNGYCLYNCNRCTQLCPTGAIMPLTRDEKHSYVCGKARVEQSNCIGCGQCVRRCPRDAVSLITVAGSRRVASVDTGLCIGCGACEYICPARPEKAIGVDGNMT